MITSTHSKTGTSIVTMQGESSALVPTPNSTFSISETALSFGQVAPGQSKSLIFSVGQSYVGSLLTVTSDAPEQFLVATDKHPNFTASLQVDLSAGNTYVHVRYLTHKVGTHTGQLHIQGESVEQTIALSGRTARFLPALSTARALNAYAQPIRRKPVPWLTMGGIVTAAVVIIGLVWIGLTKKSAPSTPSTVESRPVEVEKPVVATRPERDKAQPAKQLSLSTSRPKRVAKETRTTRLTTSTVNKTQLTNQVEEKSLKTAERSVKQPLTEPNESGVKPVTQLATKPLNKQTRPIPATGESELEKELNQPTSNQPR